MRKGRVFYKNVVAGVLSETDDGEYVFLYDASFVTEHPGDFITFTMWIIRTMLTPVDRYNNRSFFGFVSVFFMTIRQMLTPLIFRRYPASDSGDTLPI